MSLALLVTIAFTSNVAPRVSEFACKFDVNNPVLTDAINSDCNELKYAAAAALAFKPE